MGKVKEESAGEKCFRCKYRGKIPGDAHTRCDHPTPHKNNVEGDEHGKKSGWFNHPHNFSPVWLKNCDGFTPK